MFLLINAVNVLRPKCARNGDRSNVFCLHILNWYETEFIAAFIYSQSLYDLVLSSQLTSFFVSELLHLMTKLTSIFIESNRQRNAVPKNTILKKLMDINCSCPNKEFNCWNILKSVNA